MPKFYTASEEGNKSEETKEEEVKVPENAIWDLADRSNKYNPAQDMGKIPPAPATKQGVVRGGEGEEVPFYLGKEGEEGTLHGSQEELWGGVGSEGGQAAEGCPFAHGNVEEVHTEL